MDFGAYLRKLREKADYTIRDVVEMCGNGLDKTTISRIERNERRMSLAAAFYFSELYDVDIKTLAKKALGESAKVKKMKPVKRKRGRKKAS
jgi:transcriptional regulator with XRE-family HTH domain